MRYDYSKDVVCVDCFEKVERRDDLVTSFRWMAVKPFHAACYAKSIRGLRSFFVNNYPINGAMYMVGVVISLLIGLFVVFPFMISAVYTAASLTHVLYSFVPMSVVMLLVVSPALIRYYSWVRYEKKLL